MNVQYTYVCMFVYRNVFHVSLPKTYVYTYVFVQNNKQINQMDVKFYYNVKSAVTNDSTILTTSKILVLLNIILRKSSRFMDTKLKSNLT